MKTRIVLGALFLTCLPAYAETSAPAITFSTMPRGAVLQDCKFSDIGGKPMKLPMCKSIEGGLHMGFKHTDCFVDAAGYILLPAATPVHWVVIWNNLEVRNGKCWYNTEPMDCTKAHIKYGK